MRLWVLPVLPVVGLVALTACSSAPPKVGAPVMGGSCQYQGGYYGGAQAGHWTKIAGKPFCMPNGAKQGHSSEPAAAPRHHSNNLPVGTTYQAKDSSGDAYHVTVIKVLDPATGADSFTMPDKGKRFVGVVLTVRGVSGNADDDADNNTTLIGSNGQTYTSDVDQIAGYTDFNFGEFNVSPGQVSTGAVTFQVPTGVRVERIQWDASGGFGGQPATWVIH